MDCRVNESQVDEGATTRDESGRLMFLTITHPARFDLSTGMGRVLVIEGTFEMVS